MEITPKVDLKKVESLVAPSDCDARAPTMGIESLAKIWTKALQILIAKASSPPARYRHQKISSKPKSKLSLLFIVIMDGWMDGWMAITNVGCSSEALSHLMIS